MKLFRLLLLTILATNIANAQLNDFNLQVTKTNETCLGNGTLTITTTNVTPSATMLYKVYKLPDLTNPVAIQSTGFVSSLTSGTYKVIAIQALGDLSNSQEKQIAINDNMVQFNFTISSSNLNCATGGTITITATSGIAAQFEIIDGPVTRPLQTSNVFEDLPGGAYKIRVYNNCGEAKVKNYTFNLINSVLNIGNTYYEGTPVICDSITVSNLISPSSGTISYPLAVEYELLPLSMAGETIVINQTYASGQSDSLVVSAVVPRYLTETYTYMLRVTDNCNTTYEKMDNVVDPNIDLALDKGPMLCGNRFLKLSAAKHMAPFTVEFLESPAGFIPEDFNPAGLGPFTEDNVDYGNENLAVPFGTYIVKITDACGRTAEETILIEFEDLEPTVRANNNGCFAVVGRIRINITDQTLTSATIISAPSTYTQALPQDVTSYINNNGMLVLEDMPIGTYTITFTDDCGFTYTEEVDVPPFVEKDFNIATLPDCTAGYGTVRVRSGNGELTSVEITAAPAAFGQSLPFDVTNNIDVDSGNFYINNLPGGTYTFKAVDICGIEKSLTTNVEGYVPPQNSIFFNPGCGSFSVQVQDGGNGTDEVAYFLQKYNPATGQWTHPNVTANVYEEGTLPTTSTGVKLTNNIMRNNLSFVGTFRVLKKFETFGNGISDKSICISDIGGFTFTDEFSISNAYSLACTGSPNDIYIQAVGYNLTYKIEKKDGVDFVIDNGDNNVFTNLEPAVYLFTIEDECGNKLTKEVNMNELPSIADANQPQDMHICVEEGSAGSSYEYHLTDQNAAILGNVPAALYTITYHLTQQDADNGVNALPEYYASTSNGQVIYARLVNNHIALCYGTTSFALFIGEYPQAQVTTEGVICEGGLLTLTATAGFDSYLWSTGETTRTISVSEPGNYTVIVENEYGTEKCGTSAQVEIFESSAPEIYKIDTSDWTREENTITIYANGSGLYEYSLDGINFQAENVFTNLQPGVYNVYVKDVHGCGMDVKEVVLMHYPNFFTPNGDGVHDKWRIKYSNLEPHFYVTILDRYGKIITGFGATSEGWDGTLNGAQLPSTDYWFVVKREDGRELKGHFAMLR